MSEKPVNHIKIKDSEILVNQPIGWTVFNKAGKVLLHEGTIVKSERQLEIMFEKGLYREAGEAEVLAQEEDEGKAQAVQEYRYQSEGNSEDNPFSRIHDFMGRLFDILRGVADGKLRDIRFDVGMLCADIQLLCTEDSDAALSAIHLVKKGSYIVRHPIHCALLCELVCAHVGMPPAVRRKTLAAVLTANVGMFELQDCLQMQLEPASEKQREQIQRHSEISVSLLKAAGVDDQDWLNIVLHHHERVDGSGYPKGLVGDEIEVGARIISLADIYHAKISERAYRVPMLPTLALRDLFLSKGKEVDESLAYSFIKELGVFPPGGMVRLYNGEIAVVTHRAKSDSSPRVASLIAPRGVTYGKPLVRHCGQREYAIKETATNDSPLESQQLLALWGY